MKEISRSPFSEGRKVITEVYNQKYKKMKHTIPPRLRKPMNMFGLGAYINKVEWIVGTKMYSESLIVHSDLEAIEPTLEDTKKWIRIVIANIERRNNDLKPHDDIDALRTRLKNAKKAMSIFNNFQIQSSQ